MHEFKKNKFYLACSSYCYRTAPRAVFSGANHVLHLPGFEPETSCTKSMNHTTRPEWHSDMYICKNKSIWTPRRSTAQVLGAKFSTHTAVYTSFQNLVHVPKNIVPGTSTPRTEGKLSRNIIPVFFFRKGVVKSVTRQKTLQEG
jgi:hypothetical protein